MKHDFKGCWTVILSLLSIFLYYSCAGNTALHYAASGGFVDVARELILAGAKVEEPNENGHTPLMEAATAGQVEVAALLLSKGAKINTHSTEFKESALTLACYKGWLSVVLLSYSQQFFCCVEFENSVGGS